MPTQNPAQALVALRAQAAALAASIDALAASLETPSDEILGVAAARKFGAGRDALIAAATRGELELTRGPRNRLQVRRSELERWLQSRPYVPSPKAEHVTSIAEWEKSVRRKAAS